MIHPFNPFPKQRILDSFKLEEFADENSKFVGSCRNFPKTGKKH